MNSLYAFVLNDPIDWKLSTADHWEWSIIELEGNEKVIGHHRIDGAVFKVLKTSDNKIVAVSK